jgi:hypothetical protein
VILITFLSAVSSEFQKSGLFRNTEFSADFEAVENRAKKAPKKL